MTSPEHPSPITVHATKRVERKARRNKALELRRIGLTYRMIARTLNTSARQAYNDVQRAMKEGEGAGAGEEDELVVLERKLTDLRLESVITALHKDVNAGKYHAIDRWLRACEIRRKLLRLDRPESAEQASALERKYIDSSVLEDGDEEQIEEATGDADKA